MPYIGKQLSHGNYLKLDDISSSFNGSTTTFSLTNGGSAYYPGSEFSILVSVGGVIQEPESAYQINNDEITFANAPTAQDSFFCIVLGDAIGINVPGNNTVNGAQMAKPFNYDGGLLYLNDTDNRVGINSTSPSVALDVVGDLNVSGNISGIGGTLGGTLVGNVYASSGISTFNDLLVNGDLTVQGDTTTLNTTLRNVELLRVSAASTLPAGIVTQTGTGDILRLYDSNAQIVTVADGGNVTLKSTNPVVNIQGTNASSTAESNINFLLRDGNSADRTIAKLIARNTGNGGYGALDFYTAFNNTNTRRMSIHQNGYVGINTATPATQLQIVGSTASAASSGGTLGIRQKGDTNNDGITLTSSHANSARFYKDSGGALHIYNTGGSSNDFVLTNAGKVGIGTADPDAKLEVVGDDGVSVFNDAKSATVQLGTGRIELSRSDSVSYIDFKTGSVEDFDCRIQQYSNGLRFYTGGQGNTDERLRIDSDGKVGIGTGDPGTQLHLYGATPIIRLTDTDTTGPLHTNIDGASGYLVLDVGSVHRDVVITSVAQANEIARFTGDGKVGIGTDNPTSHNDTTALHIYDDYNSQGYPRIRLTNQSSGSSSSDGYEIVLNGNDLDVVHRQRENADIYFMTNNAYERLRITSAGKLGIGITNPNAMMQIISDQNAETNRFDSSNYHLMLQNTGNDTGEAVGMGFAISDDTDKVGGAILFERSGGGSAGDLEFFTNSDGASVTERLRIKSDGKLFLHGTGATGSNNTTTLLDNGYTFNLHGTSSEDGISVVRYSASYGAYGLNIGKSRSNTFGTNTAVQDGNELGHISFYGADGTNFEMAAQITGLCDGEVATSSDGTDMPGALVFKTSNDGSDTPTEKLRITSDGKIGINQDIPTAELEVAPNGSSTTSTIFIHAPTHNTNAQSEAILKFGYGHSGSPDGVGHIKMVEDANNSFDADFIFGLPINNSSGGSVTNERVRITSEGQIRVQGTYDGSSSTSNVFPCLNINNLQGSYTEDNIIGGVTFGKAPGHSSGIRAGIVALYSDNGSDGSNIGTDLAFRTAANTAGDSQERLRIRSDGSVNVGATPTSGIGKLNIKPSGDDEYLKIRDAGDFGSYNGIAIDCRNAANNASKDIVLRSNTLSLWQAANERIVIDNNGNINQSSGGGAISYFKGSSEYVFGSSTSSPPSGGAEGKFQIHDAKTRATLSLNAYMNNAGAPFLQFVSSRSGTVGTLGTKAAISDYHGDIRFMGDNGTNYNSLVQSAAIQAKQVTTISDGDTVCGGELQFYTGNTSAGSVTEKFRVSADGKIKYGLDTMGLPGSIQGGGFMMYADNGSNNVTRLTFTGLISGCYIATIGYYNAAGQGMGGAMFFVSGYQTATHTYDIHEVRRWDGAGNSDISGVTKNASNWYIEITNTHASYNGGGEVNLYGDAQATFAVTYSQ